MVKLASEQVDRVEKRQGLPSEEAPEKSHGHVRPSISHPPTRLRFKKHRSPVRMRPNRSMVEGVRNCLALRSKPRARPESDFTEISCSPVYSHPAPQELVKTDR